MTSGRCKFDPFWFAQPFGKRRTRIHKTTNRRNTPRILYEEVWAVFRVQYPVHLRGPNGTCWDFYDGSRLLFETSTHLRRNKYSNHNSTLRKIVNPPSEIRVIFTRITYAWHLSNTNTDYRGRRTYLLFTVQNIPLTQFRRQNSKLGPSFSR